MAFGEGAPLRAERPTARAQRATSVTAMDGFQVEVDDAGGVVTVRLIGELDMATRPLLEPLLAVVQARPAEVVVDLSRLDFIDSSGLRAVLNGRKMAGDLGVG